MKKVIITECPGFEEWRIAAREALQENTPPEQIVWQGIGAEPDLFVSSPFSPTTCKNKFSVPKSFISEAELAICHSDSERFALLYRILWRLRHENKSLLQFKTDDDILYLKELVKAVRRDAYKIKAFLRFREIIQDNNPHFIAWYEPEHYSLELSLPFFQSRFKNMNWSILTPYLGAHWNGDGITLTANPDPSQYPKEDTIEKYWLKYYASTFNPARPKKQAMLTQMPKKYWKNMPETKLIMEMLQTSEAKARKMVEMGQPKERTSLVES